MWCQVIKVLNITGLACVYMLFYNALKALLANETMLFFVKCKKTTRMVPIYFLTAYIVKFPMHVRINVFLLSRFMHISLVCNMKCKCLDLIFLEMWKTIIPLLAEFVNQTHFLGHFKIAFHIIFLESGILAVNNTDQVHSWLWLLGHWQLNNFT